jgi:hypothetical protein
MVATVPPPNVMRAYFVRLTKHALPVPMERLAKMGSAIYVLLDMLGPLVQELDVLSALRELTRLKTLHPALLVLPALGPRLVLQHVLPALMLSPQVGTRQRL